MTTDSKLPDGSDHKPIDLLLLADQDDHRLGLVDGLSAAGYTHIQLFEDVVSIQPALEKSWPDVLLLDGTVDPKSFSLIRDIRQSGDVRNPFLPILFLTPQEDQNRSRQAIHAGADDILMKPVKITALVNRLAALVRARRPFVVTADYIGPERRRDPSRPSELPYVQVPNTLRSKYLGQEVGTADLEAQIAATGSKINAQRQERNAFQLLFLVQILLPELKAGLAPDLQTSVTFKALRHVADDLLRRLPGSPYESLETRCQQLVDTTRAIGQNIANPRPKDLALLPVLTANIARTLHAEVDEKTLLQQIDAAVSRYKERQTGRPIS